MSTWEDRMAANAALRAAKAEAEQRQREDEERARLIAENPLFAWEDPDPVPDGRHAGHRTHSHPWHGMHVVMCQCGATLGVGCVAIDPGSPPLEPDPCPVCIARGVPLDRR
jgi:hypothetical protein